MHFPGLLVALVTMSVLWHSPGNAGPVPKIHGSCPIGWLPYTQETPFSCSQIRQGVYTSASNAIADCAKQNTSLIVVDSDKKLEFVKGLVGNVLTDKIWLGLKFTSNGARWLTSDGNDKPATSLPTTFRQYLENTNIFHHHVQLSSMGKMSIISHFGYRRYRAGAVCETRLECDSGYYGTDCRKECHCHGSACKPDFQGRVTCPYGCSVGWMGNGCSQPKEDASVTYFCVRSSDAGNYVHIRINTKGVPYEGIGAINKYGASINWCNNTEVTFSKAFNVQTIKIYIDDEAKAEMETGQCAGHVDNANFTWRIRIQEKKSFVSKNDQIVGIACGKFEDYDSLTADRTTAVLADVITKEEMLAPKSELVDLRVVDAFTGKVVDSVPVESSVVLKISYGLGTDTELSGVEPYNCYTSSANGSQIVNLLDEHGCPVSGSIISSFSSNGTKSLITEAFPLLRLPGSNDLTFQCSYALCFDDDICVEGCSNQTTTENSNRREKRSITEHRLVRVVTVNMPQS